MQHLDPDREMPTPNLGSLFAQHLVSLKMKPFKGTGKKKETVGSLLTPIFMHLGIRLDAASARTFRAYLDAGHLSSAQWLKEGLRWSFRTGERLRLLQLPAPHITDFTGSIDRLRFQPDAAFLRNLQDMPHRVPGARRAPAIQGPPEAPLPDFPIILEIPIRDHGDFQRVVTDALQAIWARVSRCRCMSRRSVRASDPSAAGPSHQYEHDSSAGDDEAAEDSD
ncbi:hypothetical protein Bca101_057447 [Brassica carinata]